MVLGLKGVVQGYPWTTPHFGYLLYFPSGYLGYLNWYFLHPEGLGLTLGVKLF